MTDLIEHRVDFPEGLKSTICDKLSSTSAISPNAFLWRSESKNDKAFADAPQINYDLVLSKNEAYSSQIFQHARIKVAVSATYLKGTTPANTAGAIVADNNFLNMSNCSLRDQPLAQLWNTNVDFAGSPVSWNAGHDMLLNQAYNSFYDEKELREKYSGFTCFGADPNYVPNTYAPSSLSCEGFVTTDGSGFYTNATYANNSVNYSLNNGRNTFFSNTTNTSCQMVHPKNQFQKRNESCLDIKFGAVTNVGAVLSQEVEFELLEPVRNPALKQWGQEEFFLFNLPRLGITLNKNPNANYCIFDTSLDGDIFGSVSTVVEVQFHRIYYKSMSVPWSMSEKCIIPYWRPYPVASKNQTLVLPSLNGSTVQTVTFDMGSQSLSIIPKYFLIYGGRKPPAGNYGTNSICANKRGTYGLTFFKPKNLRLVVQSTAETINTTPSWKLWQQSRKNGVKSAQFDNLTYKTSIVRDGKCGDANLDPSFAGSYYGMSSSVLANKQLDNGFVLLVESGVDFILPNNMTAGMQSNFTYQFSIEYEVDSGLEMTQSTATNKSTRTSATVGECVCNILALDRYTIEITPQSIQQNPPSLDPIKYMDLVKNAITTRYVIEDTEMMGGGLLSLAKKIKGFLPYVNKALSIGKEVASKINHPIAQDVAQTLGEFGYGKRRPL